MVTVSLQKVPKKKEDPLDIIFAFCYHFPQYKFSEARKLPYKRISQMLRVARIEHSKKMLDLLRVVSAPHAKGGVRKANEYFSAIIKI